MLFKVFAAAENIFYFFQKVQKDDDDDTYICCDEYIDILPYENWSAEKVEKMIRRIH